MRKKIIIGILVLLGLVIIGSVGYRVYMKRQAKAEAELARDYKHQNQMLTGAVQEYEFMGYEAMDEGELYVRLTVYNMEHPEGPLTLEDIKEYLSQEYNEDGTLRIYSGYENIRNYENWYYIGGCDRIEEYWRRLEDLAMDYKGSHPSFTGGSVHRMSVEQLQELIKKEADSSYEINDAVMEGE